MSATTRAAATQGEAGRSAPVNAWVVYILRCADGTFYTGCAKDLAARHAAHNAGRGAKYTAGRRPVALVYSEPCESMGAALRRERELKRLTRARKAALVGGAV